MPRICGAVQNYFRSVDIYPELRRNQAELEARTRARTASTFPTRIPVVVHILHHNDGEDISDEQVHSQIEVLNEDFASQNPHAGDVPEAFRDTVGNPGLEFVLAENGINRYGTKVAEFDVDDRMKASESGGADPWDTSKYLNIWVCRISGGVLGYAQFPGGAPETDGVVILSSAFGRGGSAQTPFDLGRTTTHEVGHYLNLSHIWGEARVPTCEDTDFVDDTPTQLGPNFGKPAFPTSSCPKTPNGDMFMNYMDYVDDDSMFMFTRQQVERMHMALEVARPKLGE
jgi:hypothetical protein